MANIQNNSPIFKCEDKESFQTQVGSQKVESKKVGNFSEYGLYSASIPIC